MCCLYFLGLQSAISHVPLENRALLPLLNALPSVLVHSRADNTVENYYYAFQSWDRWAKLYGLVSLPAQPVSLALYLLFRIQQGGTYAVCKGAVYGIKHIHKLHMASDPTEEPLVLSMLEASKRLDTHVVVKREPITIDILQKLYTTTVKGRGSLNDIRVMCFSILGYSGFLRYDELSSLRVCDIVFQPTHVRVFIEKSKTDQYRDGKWCYIANGDTELCPTKIIHLYLEKCGITDFTSDEYLFRAISKGKYYEKLRNKNKPISYTRVREILLAALKEIGVDTKVFGTHSLRAGGATQAANSGVPDRLFKKHGRWRSESAKDGYIKDNTEQLLRVSRSLGL